MQARVVKYHETQTNPCIQFRLGRPVRKREHYKNEEWLKGDEFSDHDSADQNIRSSGGLNQSEKHIITIFDNFHYGIEFHARLNFGRETDWQTSGLTDKQTDKDAFQNGAKYNQLFEPPTWQCLSDAGPNVGMSESQ